ncbi:MAG: HEAT repeat domain-containing protein [Candidatus Dormibacteraeota bacterium]|nr:HEAT repeat domain-containing protein [Candidatus Dormibacteraeota bacterium]
MDEPERNQPAPEIAGGRTRASTLAGRQGLLGVLARERVTAILRIHDLDESSRALAELTDADQAMVRQIAREGAISGVEPAVRYKAISALAQRPVAENLNLLADLAQFGEDFYVRGHALIAVGQTGMVVHLAILLPRVGASEQFERAAALHALGTLAARVSPEAVEAHALALGGDETLARAREALAASQAARTGRTSQRSQSERREEASGSATT